MTQKTVSIPDFDFSGLYYPEIVQALRQYGRINVPEMTDESDYEPFIQLERAFALVGHLCNVNLDAAALESQLPTSRTREGVKNLLQLIDYRVSEATPAHVDVIAEITKIFTTPIQLIEEHSLFATQQLVVVGVVFFEVDASYTIQPNNVLSGAYADDLGVLTDYTNQANTNLSWTPWVVPIQNNAVYFGHRSVMFDLLSIDMTTPGSGYIGAWEYYDGDWKDASPDSVDNLGSQLKFDLTTFLGDANRAGLEVRVTHLPTTAYEDATVLWEGGKNVCYTSLLGQSTPSEIQNDYAIGSDWNQLNIINDTTNGLTVGGAVQLELPQTSIDKWIMHPDFAGMEAYWVRFRIVEATTPVSPVLARVNISNGRQYIMVECTQGETVKLDPIAVSTGQPSQQYNLAHKNLIEGSTAVQVGLQDWECVDNFLSSTPSSKHFTVLLPEDEFPVLIFGNGVSGRIPPLGEDIVVEYRIGADNDGNVGARTIITNASGIAFLGSIYNPRPAHGWVDREGSTDIDLARLKVAGPASLRVRGRAISPDDCEVLATQFVDSNGSLVVSRALAIEESFGIKTIELVCVGSGGFQISDDSKEELHDYFNGDEIKGIKGVLVINHELTVTDFQPRLVEVTATVYGGVKEQIENLLAGLLNPEAKKDDGSFEWEFGGEVPKSRIISEIFKVTGVRKVVLTEPADDIELATRELPSTNSGLISITVEP